MTGIEPQQSIPSETKTMDPWLGSVVGERYRVEEQIGQGGMGVVYLGRHLELGKRVAIKRLDPRIASDPTSFERFRREAIAASRIESPHVVHVFDWGKAADGSPFLVMELLEGYDLRELFRREGRLLPEPAVAIVVQVLRALQRTHQAEIVHRDLKPENVYLCRYDTDEPYVKLLDFGISKQTTRTAGDDPVTRTGMIMGTASYMSPEQARGDETLDVRSDLYSVGAILFEALTGRVPHRGRTYEATLVDICTRDADDVRLHAPLTPALLAEVVARALKRDVERRYQSAKEFLEALGAAVPDASLRASDLIPDRSGPTHTDLQTTGPASPIFGHPPAKRRSRIAWLVPIVVLAGATLVGWALWRRQSRAILPQADLSAHPSPAQSGQSPAAANSIGVRYNDPRAPQNQTHSTATTTDDNQVRPLHPRPSFTDEPRNGSANSPEHSGTGANDHASGVASGLKLRRTMP
jgi:eukaryotic-like serine/threonine-protein kinase